MKLNKQLNVTAFSLIMAIAVLMGKQGDVFAGDPCPGLRKQAHDLKTTWKNDKEYLDEEGEILAGHDVVKAIKANLPVLEASYHKVVDEFNKHKCKPELGEISDD